MKDIRQLHLYLGCIFAPLIIYFSLSGAWQIFRLNDLPKNEPATKVQIFLHELSKPHKSSTVPGADSKLERSVAFDYAALLMSFGLLATTLLGLVLAFRFNRSPRTLFVCVAFGFILPIVLLYLR